jgi:hypothetical protein
MFYACDVLFVCAGEWNAALKILEPFQMKSKGSVFGSGNSKGSVFGSGNVVQINGLNFFQCRACPPEQVESDFISDEHDPCSWCDQEEVLCNACCQCYCEQCKHNVNHQCCRNCSLCKDCCCCGS